MGVRLRGSRSCLAAALAMWTTIGASAGCGPFAASAPTICDHGQRTELLSATLEPYTPSATFTLKLANSGWIQVTKLPQADEEPFVRLAGAAELYSLRGGATPNITTNANGDKEPHDPSITIDKGLTWQQLPLGSGDWQLYSFSNPGIEVVSCPNG